MKAVACIPSVGGGYVKYICSVGGVWAILLLVFGLGLGCVDGGCRVTCVAKTGD